MSTMDYTYAERQRTVVDNLYNPLTLERPVDSIQIVGDASIALAAEDTNAIVATITVLDIEGEAVERVTPIEIVIAEDDAGTIATTAPDGAVAVPAEGSGSIDISFTAKKHLLCRTDASGVLELSITESGDNSFWIMAILPSGYVVISDELDFETE